MADDDQAYLAETVKKKYEYGFVTDIEVDEIPPGLNEAVDPPYFSEKK